MKQKNRPTALPLGLLLIAVALLAANLRAPLAALGPLVGMIQADLRTSGTFMGIVAALPMLAFALFSPFAPKAARRFGMERVLAASLALMIVGLVCRSSGPSENLLAGGTLLLAAAIAMGNVLLPARVRKGRLKICFQTASQAIYGGCVRLGTSARLWVCSPFCFIRWSISCLRC